MIIDQVCQAQCGNEDATLNLISQFTPVLRKYARRLEYEDAYSDLVAEFIDLIARFNSNKIKQKNDGAMVRYLVQSIYHSYTKLLQQLIDNNPTTVSLDELSDSINFSSNNVQFQNIFSLEIPDNLLSVTEKETFIKVHFYGYSSAELARSKGVSRQSINQAKRSAEKKLRNYLIKTGQYIP